MSKTASVTTAAPENFGLMCDSMSTMPGPYSQSYEPVSRDAASRRMTHATENPDLTRAGNSVQPRSLLAEFVKLPSSSFRSYADFIDENPRILDEQASTLQGLATQAYRVNNSDLAERYLELNVILHKCKLKSREERYRYIQNLGSRNYKGNYHDAVEELVSAVRKQAVPSSITPAVIEQRMQGLDIGDTSRPQAVGRKDGKDQVVGQSLRPENRQRRTSDQEQRPQGGYEAIKFQSQPKPFSLEGAEQQFHPHGGHTRSTINNLPSALSAAFQLRSSAFFQVGRIFRVLWHQPAGSDLRGKLANSTSVGKFREPIYTTARWMLVVKEKLGHCICCPISTYGGRGLESKKFQQSEIRAHAIMYGYGMPPPQNTGLVKPPIPVFVQENGTRVDPISSVNFSKLHTVEHNVKVANIGMIPENLHRLIIQYVSEEFLA